MMKVNLRLVSAIATLLLISGCSQAPISRATPSLTPKATTPEKAFASYLRAVDAGLLSGGRDTSAMSALVPKATDVGRVLATKAQRLADYENLKAVGFGTWAASHSDTYKSVTSVPTTRSVSVIGTRATIVDDVATTLLWSSMATSKVSLDPRKAADVQKARRQGRAFGPGDIVTSIVSTRHTVVLELVNGSWHVVSDVYLDPFNDTVTIPSSTPTVTPTVSIDRNAVYSQASAYLQSFLDSWQKNGLYAAGQKYLDSRSRSKQKQGNPVLLAGTVTNMQQYSWVSVDHFTVMVGLDLRFSGGFLKGDGGWGSGTNDRFVTFVRSSASAPYQMTLATGPPGPMDHSADYVKATAYLQSFLDSWKKNGFYAACQKYLDSSSKSKIQKQGNPVLIAGTVDNIRPYSWISADNFVVLVDLHLRFSTQDAGAWGNGVNTLFVTFARSSAVAPYKLRLNSSP